MTGGGGFDVRELKGFSRVSRTRDLKNASREEGKTDGSASQSVLLCLDAITRGDERTRNDVMMRGRWKSSLPYNNYVINNDRNANDSSLSLYLCLIPSLSSAHLSEAEAVAIKARKYV